jgi:hypothetical protein
MFERTLRRPMPSTPTARPRFRFVLGERQPRRSAKPPLLPFQTRQRCGRRGRRLLPRASDSRGACWRTGALSKRIGRAECVARLHNLSADVLIANVAAPVRSRQRDAAAVAVASWPLRSTGSSPVAVALARWRAAECLLPSPIWLAPDGSRPSLSIRDGAPGSREACALSARRGSITDDVEVLVLFTEQDHG